MSDHVQELLGRGLEALKMGLPANAQEARHYLERVLGADDAEHWQKARAWLYLSRIEEDPVQRRVCFESALVLDPGNAEAHQGLAILDGRLKIEDITDADKPLQPVIPNAELPASGARRLACPKCGAKMLVKSGEQEMVCSYCGTHLEGDHSDSYPVQVKEEDFFAALPTAKRSNFRPPSPADEWRLPVLRIDACGQ